MTYNIIIFRTTGKRFYFLPILFMILVILLLPGCDQEDEVPKSESELCECDEDTYTIEDIGSAQVDGIYPQGKNFALGLYAVAENQIHTISQYGWNIAHIYRSTPETSREYVETCKENGVLTLVVVPYVRPEDFSVETRRPVDSLVYANYIKDISETKNVAWWDMPEELMYWRPEEYKIMTEYPVWTRNSDPHRSPIYMYLPQTYSEEAIMRHVRHLDVISASLYSHWSSRPRTLVRFQIELTYKAIERLREVEGKDYLNNEKTVVGVLELHTHLKEGVVITPEDVHHDFWQAIASGAKGLFVYLHAHRTAFPKAWEQLCTNALNLTGEENLDQVVLYGKIDPDVSFTILEGEKMAPPMVVKDVEVGVYPSLNLRAWIARDKNGTCHKYIIAVNSSPSPIVASISKVTNNKGSKAKVLFEERNDIQIVNGEFMDTFDGYGVHIYKIQL